MMVWLKSAVITTCALTGAVFAALVLLTLIRIGPWTIGLLAFALAVYVVRHTLFEGE